MQPVLFDFNGTMFLDTDKNEYAWKRMILEATGYELTAADFKEYVHGRPNEYTIRYYIGQDLTEEQVAAYSQQKEVFYRASCLADPAHLQLTEGLPEFLDYLAVQGVPHNIATSADRSNVDFYWEHLGLGKWFDLKTIVYQDGSFKGKPAPDIYFLAAKRLGVDIKTCWVFEDAYMGVLSAHNAQVAKIIGVAAIPANDFLYDLPQVTQVIKDFTCWRELVK